MSHSLNSLSLGHIERISGTSGRRLSRERAALVRAATIAVSSRGLGRAGGPTAAPQGRRPPVPKAVGFLLQGDGGREAAWRAGAGGTRTNRKKSVSDT